jgi:hypothetical protein
MGMFDYLRVEIEIPGCGDCSAEEFQTKDFENLMDQYVITKNGELYKECWEYKWIDDDSLQYIKSYLERIPDSYRREYLTNYHGDVNFYSGSMIDSKWRDYYARFTDGKLTKIWYTDK